jgi:teichuronic acid exporter
VGDNPLELKRLHIRFFQFGAFIIFPIIFGLIASAESFVVVIYSEKWLPSVQILQILALTSIPIFLGALFSQTIKVIGDGGLYFKLTSLKKVLGLLSIPFGLFFGLTSFVIAFVFLHFVGLLLDFYFCGKQLNIKVYAYIKYLFKPTFISLLMGCVVYSII